MTPRGALQLPSRFTDGPTRCGRARLGFEPTVLTSPPTRTTAARVGPSFPLHEASATDPARVPALPALSTGLVVSGPDPAGRGCLGSMRPQGPPGHE